MEPQLDIDGKILLHIKVTCTFTLGPNDEIDGEEVNQSVLRGVAQKVVKDITVIPEALLGEPACGRQWRLCA